jgi:hypothetical protein
MSMDCAHWEQRMMSQCLLLRSVNSKVIQVSKSSKLLKQTFASAITSVVTEVLLHH